MASNNQLERPGENAALTHFGLLPPGRSAGAWLGDMNEFRKGVFNGACSCAVPLSGKGFHA
jgi:hypothetical protein